MARSFGRIREDGRAANREMARAAAYEPEGYMDDGKSYHDDEFIDLVHRAWEDWQAAQNYFESVSEPELVDYAIYDLEAARRKYIYMLNKTRAYVE